MAIHPAPLLLPVHKSTWGWTWSNKKPLSLQIPAGEEEQFIGLRDLDIKEHLLVGFYEHRP